MIRFSARPVLIAVMLTALAVAIGCQDQSDTRQHTDVRSRHAKPSPEESFALIVETFRRGVEEVPIGFVLHDSEGHSMMTGRNEVSHELIPPAKEGDLYKAVITVGSQSRYSIQRLASETDEKDDDQAGDQTTDSFGESDDKSGLEVYDQDLISDSGGKNQDRRATPSPAEKTEKTVTRQADRQERKYELVYQNGRWSLITTLDPETEQSIQNAFKRALETQI
ncbi:MAG: hypothetical protein WD738_16060 [Pirellulales bacterium]